MAALVGALSIGAGFAGGAMAAQIGATGGGINCGFVAAAVEPSYVVPAGGGQITSFSTQTRSGDVGATIDFLLLRPAGSSYTVVGHTGPVTVSGTGLETFPASIPAQAGDVLGMWWTPFCSDCLRITSESLRAVLGLPPSDPGPGSTVSFDIPQEAST